MALQAAAFDTEQGDPRERLRRRLVGQIAPAEPVAPLAPQTAPLAPAPFTGQTTAPMPTQSIAPAPFTPTAGAGNAGQDAQITALRSRMQAAGGMAANSEIQSPEPPPEPGLPSPTPAPVNTPANPPNNTAPLEPPVAPPPPGAAANTGPSPGNGWSAGSNYAMPGWDQDKWAGGHSSPKYLGGHAMSALGAATVENLAQVADYLRRQGRQVEYSGGDVITVDGVPIDAIKDVGGAGASWQWEPAGGAQGASGGVAGETSKGSPNAAAGGVRAGSGVNPSANHPGTGSTEAEWATSKVLSGEWTQEQANDYLGGGGGGGSLTASSSSSTSSPFNDEIRAMLMERMKLAGQPVDENASGISGAVSAARDEQTRAAQDERTQLAERLYAQGGGGLDSNALTQQIQQSGERNAQATSGLRSQLIMKEFGRKAQELQGYMQMALASGDAEMARQIQVQQMQLEAELRREGMGVSLAEFMAQLNQNTAMAGLNG